MIKTDREPLKKARWLRVFEGLVCCFLVFFSITSSFVYYYSDTGYSVSPEVLSNLFNRFSKRMMYMKIDDFVAFVCRVKYMDGKINDQ